MSRSPILDYATYNPVTEYIPPVDEVIDDTLLTEAGVTLTTEAGDSIQQEG